VKSTTTNFKGQNFTTTVARYKWHILSCGINDGGAGLLYIILQIRLADKFKCTVVQILLNVNDIHKEIIQKTATTIITVTAVLVTAVTVNN